ncbi:AAA family ATPase [Candidatus Amoebophilus asiaticus]|uniref:AAA family ATPase n=1 Tax=Candidatus Amoebophilus asiaticus TaxID=281120 RepID=UPI0011D162D8|nr:AAA family ATPase [Candidatus Amoebophilus asiaticus]
MSYIQGMLDERGQNVQFILTGSGNLLLSEKINQSLAGRAYICNLLPLSLEELQTSTSHNYMHMI